MKAGAWVVPNAQEESFHDPETMAAPHLAQSYLTVDPGEKKHTPCFSFTHLTLLIRTSKAPCALEIVDNVPLVCDEDFLAN